MSYVFDRDRMYRMPTHFGPSPGPRQRLDGGRWDCKETPNTTAVWVSFLTDGDKLAALLPPRFQLSEQPIVTVEAAYSTNIGWLAGRGYNVVVVRFPAIYRGQVDQCSGQFLAVVWENLADPIITGREELGWPKVY